MWTNGLDPLAIGCTVSIDAIKAPLFMSGISIQSDMHVDHVGEAVIHRFTSSWWPAGDRRPIPNEAPGP